MGADMSNLTNEEKYNNLSGTGIGLILGLQTMFMVIPYALNIRWLTVTEKES